MKKLLIVLLFGICLCGCKKEEKPYRLSFNDSEKNVRNAIYFDANHTYKSEDFEIVEYPTLVIARPKRRLDDYIGIITMDGEKTFSFTIKRQESDSFYNDYPSVNTKDHAFEIIDYDTLLTLFDEGDHILYLGFPACPWCVEYVTYYNEVAKEQGKRIKYYDIKDIRKIVDGSLNSDFQALVDKIDPEYLSEKVENDVTYDWIYAPTLYVIKNGQVVARVVGGIEGHNILERSLTKKEKEEYLDVLREMFSKI
ncbi:MAG: hypothetical protein ACOX02_05810 [Acholeplasmatales bacterium]